MNTNVKQIAAVIGVAGLLLAGCGGQSEVMETRQAPPQTQSSSSAASNVTSSTTSESSAPSTDDVTSVGMSVTEVTSSAAPKMFDVAGQLTITGTANYGGDLFPCFGAGEFGALKEGTKVSVFSADGKLLGFDDLGGGTANVNRCIMSFTVSGISAGEGPYYAEVGTLGKTPFDEPTGGREAVLVEIDLGG